MRNSNEVLRNFIRYFANMIIQGALMGAFAITLSALIAGEPILTSRHLVLMLLIIVATIGFGIRNFLAYAKPFKEIERFISQIAAGNLTHRIRMDQLGSLKRFGVPMEGMREHLGQLVLQVKQTSTEVNLKIRDLHERLQSNREQFDQIVAAMEVIAAASKQQYSAAKESAKAVEELATGIGHISEISLSVTESSSGVASMAEITRQEMLAMNEQMGKMNQSFRVLTETISQFLGRSEDIATSTDAITGILQQTHILALNANIEAARAGEQGRGFAVVATEIRKLASEANRFAEEIGELLEKAEEESNQSKSAMDTSHQEIQAGITVLGKTETVMHDILTQVETINTEMSGFSATGQQMAAGSQEVAATVDEMARSSSETTRHIDDIVMLTAQIHESIQTMSTAGDQLETLGRELQGTIESFRLDESRNSVA
ncbi:methyl-accepting chemotaxis protein [Paenibacillus sp. MBLB2552]|uniref:Methyl-accepting chemotaxis protein n=1 Tax=Paenibacillus mellifer TaxID=2937794 RepID=A0A9X2BTR9_9BACL|nr:methyl-accepting chemotaxis protein [Paenibacillus mellifer]MCK8488241.1 methyl-accepting chemotaxis protein [Paenibacillus mellifer]